MDPDVNNYLPFALYGQRYHTDDETNGLLEFLKMSPVDVNINSSNLLPLLHKHMNILRSNPVYANPSYGEEFDWINTVRPLSFDYDLGKKIYVMDFFTYCCVNCLHILPLLNEIETDFALNPGFAVIGVHSPKFSNEQNLQRVTDAVIRHGIRHPVINDSNCVLWKKFGISCWPTVFIVGPLNKLLFILVGEGQINKLKFLCNVVLDYYETCGEDLDTNCIPVSLLPKPESDTGFLYPGGVSTNNELILVSDTGKHRLVLINRDLEIQEIIGTGIAGCEDGTFDMASFNDPHGTAWYGNTVFVADTGNHCIRKVDFISKQVSTVFPPKIVEDSRIEDLVHSAESLSVSQESPRFNRTFLSPWDVCIAPELESDCKKSNVLYVAVSGSHQIWSMNLDNDRVCIPFAGTGREENRKNCYRFQASFAQPTGIAYSEVCPNYLYIADSESSAIRSISLDDGSVNTLVGGGFDPCDLFAYGDEDGKGFKVRLQHPMSLCVIHENFLAVTDTYNHKIKLIQIKKRCSTVFAKGMKLCEPSAVCVLDDNLIVADTNNHRLQYVHLERRCISEKIFRPLQELECFNTTAVYNHVTNVDVKYGSKICCYFSYLDARYRPVVAEQMWDIAFKGEGRFNIICRSSNLFSADSTIPPILLKADAFNFIKGYDECAEPCEIKLTVHTSFCDSVLKVCRYEDMVFKVNVKFTKNGCRYVNIHFVCNM